MKKSKNMEKPADNSMVGSYWCQAKRQISPFKVISYMHCAQVPSSKTQIDGGDAQVGKEASKGGWMMPRGYFCK